MDAAQRTAAIRSFLIALGGLLGGLGIASLSDFAHYFTDANIQIAAAVLGAIATAIGGFWSNRSNAPAALARKLVDNPNLINSEVAAAIKKGAPEEVKPS